MLHTRIALISASMLVLLGSCSSQTQRADDLQPALQRVPAAWRPKDQEEIRARLEQVARQYKRPGPINDRFGRASPLCRPPMPTALMSEADSGSPHSEKLYLLYAQPASIFLAAIGQLPREASIDASQPLAIVKEAYIAAPIEHDPAAAPGIAPRSDYTDANGQRYIKGPMNGLFIMLKCAEDTPDTDRGWVYATAAPDFLNTPPADAKSPAFVITSMGKIESCMECHVESKHDRVLSKRLPPS